MEKKITIDKIIALCKSRGFVFPGSEIYGGLSNSWDYGPLGVELKNSIKREWWKRFVQEKHNNVGIDAALIMNPNVWRASGHLAGFSDPLLDCKECKTRHRADHLLESLKIDVAGLKAQQLDELIVEHKIKCPDCGKSNFTKIRNFNLMFKTFIGVTEDSQNEVYLRPETAQAMFTNYKNVMRTERLKVPFGIGQVGKSFRNEITPGNFIFRTREFEQMELEFFCKPGTDLEWFSYYKNEMKQWLLDMGLSEANIRMRDHSKQELSFYSVATTDFEYLFPFGWGELWGIADRTDYDLKQHQKHSGENMEYTDPYTNEKYIPYVIEPALGLDRMFLSVLCEAYNEEEIAKDDVRVVLKFKPHLAPIKAAVFPLSKKLNESAEKIYADLRKIFNVTYDEAGSIGKRYRRQDEIGTPFCVTVDFDTENDGSVTVRERDSMKQERVKIVDLTAYLTSKIYK